VEPEDERERVEAGEDGPRPVPVTTSSHAAPAVRAAISTGNMAK